MTVTGLLTPTLRGEDGGEGAEEEGKKKTPITLANVH